MEFKKVTELRTIKHRQYVFARSLRYTVGKVETDENPLLVTYRIIPGVAGGYETPDEPPEVEVIRVLDSKTCLDSLEFEEDEDKLFQLEDTILRYRGEIDAEEDRKRAESYAEELAKEC